MATVNESGSAPGEKYGVVPMQKLYHTTLTTPIGRLGIASTRKGLFRILLPESDGRGTSTRLSREFPLMSLINSRRKNRKAARQIVEYFAGTRTEFTLKLDIRGTEFQKSVWKAVSGVVYGEIRSYSDIARQVGKPKAVRAVGSANKHNPLPIVIPCHRVVGSTGAMTGYGGGIPMKEALLRHEGMKVPGRFDV